MLHAQRQHIYAKTTPLKEIGCKIFKSTHYTLNNKIMIYNKLHTTKHKCIKTAYGLTKSINKACTTLLISLIKLRVSQDICNAFADYILNTT